jgi:hypothetical protein
MKTQQIGAGTSFNITIPLPELITEYENILLAIYTDSSRPVKFSYVAKTGYNKINIGQTSLELETLLTNAQTDKMQGCMFMEMEVIKVSGVAENIGNSVPTPIINEFGYQIEIIPTVL